MKPRVLIVEQQRELRVWLRHHVEILWPDGTPSDLDLAQFEDRLHAITSADFDLIVYGANFGAAADENCEALTKLRALGQQPDFPAIVVIAINGNELTAVAAIRAGVADYLPRDAVNAQRLGTVLRRALERQTQRAQARASRRTAAGARAAGGARRGKRRLTPRANINLPQYSLLHKLGESTRAIVYLANSAALGRNVALKISKPEIDAAEDQQYFAREYAAISALRHRSVVDIYDYGFHGGHEFIAMEYFPCGDLKTRLQQPLSVAESLEYAHRIAAALQVIHTAGLLHRDLKPPNVMLRQDGSIVLIDFGLAKNLAAYTRSTAAGVLRGSPYYMSPEQAQGIELDQRSDLYSLGVVLFEMLIGSKPYLGATALDLMHQHVHGPRPELPPELQHLDPLIESLMARSRDERIQDAAAAMQAIASAQDQLRAAPFRASTRSEHVFDAV